MAISLESPGTNTLELVRAADRLEQSWPTCRTTMRGLSDVVSAREEPSFQLIVEPEAEFPLVR